MLLEPTDKYINFIHRSAHFMTSPKHRFNEEINMLIRGYDKATAFGNIVVLFNLAKFKASDTLINELVDFHQGIHVQKFMKMNVNELTPADEQRIERRSNEVNSYIKNGTTYYPAMFGGGVNTVPSFPFQDYLKNY